MRKKDIKSRKAKAEETKNKIYKSAEQLFAKYGYDNINIDDIVGHAGVAKGSFYVHFKSKDFLVVKIISDYVNKIDIDYKNYLESFPADTSAADILISLAGKIADVIIDIIGYENIKNLYKIQIINEIDTQAVKGYNREIYKIFSDVISRGMHQRIFDPDLSVDDVARHFMIAYRGLVYEWCIHYPDFDLKAQALEHFNLMLAAIKTSFTRR